MNGGVNKNLVLVLLVIFLLAIGSGIVYLHGTVTDLLNLMGYGAPILVVLLMQNRITDLLNHHLAAHRATRRRLNAAKRRR